MNGMRYDSKYCMSCFTKRIKLKGCKIKFASGNYERLMFVLAQLTDRVSWSVSGDFQFVKVLAGATGYVHSAVILLH